VTVSKVLIAADGKGRHSKTKVGTIYIYYIIRWKEYTALIIHRSNTSTILVPLVITLYCRFGNNTPLHSVFLECGAVQHTSKWLGE